MSKYRLIKCEFRNPDSLIKALNDLGFVYSRSANMRQNDVTLHTNWGHGMWQGKDQPVAVSIEEADLSKVIGSRTMDGMGFSWNGNGYDLIQDQHDEDREDVLAAMNKLRQRYSLHEAMRLAHAKGYLVRETASQDGKIRIVLQKR